MTTFGLDSMDSPSEWPPSFRFGVWPAVGLVVAFTIWVLISATLFTQLVGTDASTFLESLWNVPSGLVQFGIIAAVYRYDGVTGSEIGLSRRLLRPAVTAVLGVIVALNAIVGGMGLLAGNQISFGVYVFYQSAPFNFSTTTIAAGAFTSYLFTGPIEELAFRGYLQNKLSSLLQLESLRVCTAISIIVTGMTFAALHIPVSVLVHEISISQLAGTLVLIALSGMLFGTIYALTQNLYLVVLLHGAGNFWPLVVAPGQGVWPNYLVLLLVYAILVIVYRRVAVRTSVPTPSLAAAD